jgi:hypothetical protein
LLGLGWRLPFGEAAHGVDFVEIRVETVGYGQPELTFTMRFGRIRRFDGDGCTHFDSVITPSAVIPEPNIEWIAVVSNIPLSKLREAYDQITGVTT